MKPVIGSNLYKASFVSAALLFVVFPGTVMWLDAFTQRQNAQNIQQANNAGELYVSLADAISIARERFYVLANTDQPDSLDVSRMLASSEAIVAIAKTDDLAAEIATPGQDKNNNTPRHLEAEKSGAMIGRLRSSGIYKDEGSANLSGFQFLGSAVGSNSSEPKVSVKTFDDVAKVIVANEGLVLEQLQLQGLDRDPSFSMSMFHIYTDLIASIDVLRKMQHIAPPSGKREFYIYSNSEDVIWNFRESVAQISALLGGIVALMESSIATAHQRHFADMLIELNVRVDLAWSELIRLADVSENQALVESINTTDRKLLSQFRSMASKLSASTRYNSVPKAEFLQWLAASKHLLVHADRIRLQMKSITLESVQVVEKSASRYLALVTLLVLFALGATVALILSLRLTHKQAHQDDLTGLDNRRKFLAILSDQISLASRNGTEIGVLMVDLDKFKHINDTKGHAAGDTLLTLVANRITSVVGNYKSVARLGGDEFAVILSGCSKHELFDIAEEIRDQLAEKFLIQNGAVKIGSSIGIAMWPGDAKSRSALIKAADTAMYSAKKSGVNEVVVYDSMFDKQNELISQMIVELETAIQSNEFVLHYQPQFNLLLNRVNAVEALIRWNHPEHGMITPDKFLPIAEENGLLPIIGDWVLNEACRQVSIWQKTCSIPLRVAVNVSSDHFIQPDFVANLLECLEKNKLQPRDLELEITETVAANDMNDVVNSLNELRTASIRVALDDFGAGYSSLGYLQELPLDTLKIDKTFIQNILKGNARHDAITKSIVSLSESLNLQSVAEGVETADQLSAVASMKVSAVQGHYYSRAVPADELISVVRKINKEHSGTSPGRKTDLELVQNMVAPTA